MLQQGSRSGREEDNRATPRAGGGGSAGSGALRGGQLFREGQEESYQAVSFGCVAQLGPCPRDEGKGIPRCGTWGTKPGAGHQGVFAVQVGAGGDVKASEGGL